VVYQRIVTWYRQRPHGILGWRQCGTHTAGPSTAGNTEYDPARGGWLPSHCG